MSVSLCMIVKNEEKMLDRCLKSVMHIVDEMIIVDTGSTDKTVQIAQGFGAKIFHYEWNNSFSDARNFSLEKADKDWILIMDADDEFEKEDTEKLLQYISDGGTTNAYFFRTLSFSGDKADYNDIISNLNVRLIRNNKGYRFSGNIHEQIVPGYGDAGRTDAIKIGDIRFYHYGYLMKTVNEKDKRRRNIELIKKELEINPENPFMLYNMGNEYYALLDFDMALEFYLKSYEYFDSQAGYSSRLIVRIVSSYEILKKTKEEFKYIDKGLKYYPMYTDLEYMRASTLLRQNEFIPAIKSLNKCIKMGEPSAYLCNLNGVGSFRAQFFLSTIYFPLGDCAKAEHYCDLALKGNSMYKDAYSHMYKILSARNLPVKSIKRRLEHYLKPDLSANAYLLLSDIFYDKNQYAAALEYAKKAEKLAENKKTALYDEGICLFYLRQFKKAYHCFQESDSKEFHDKSAFLNLLCGEFDSSICFNRESAVSPESASVYDLVFMRYKALIKGEKCQALADDEETSQPFLNPIFNLLDILIKTDHYDNFETALQLLNLVSDKSVLLRLGKLYYKNGYMQLAFKEIMRSLKLTDIIDSEGLEMMKTVIDSGILQ